MFEDIKPDWYPSEGQGLSKPVEVKRTGTLPVKMPTDTGPFLSPFALLLARADASAQLSGYYVDRVLYSYRIITRMEDTSTADAHISSVLIIGNFGLLEYWAYRHPYDTMTVVLDKEFNINDQEVYKTISAYYTDYESIRVEYSLLQEFEHIETLSNDVLALSKYNILIAVESPQHPVPGIVCMILNHLDENGKCLIVLSSDKPSLIGFIARYFKSYTLFKIGDVLLFSGFQFTVGTAKPRIIKDLFEKGSMKIQYHTQWETLVPKVIETGLFNDMNTRIPTNRRKTLAGET